MVGELFETGCEHMTDFCETAARLGEHFIPSRDDVRKEEIRDRLL
jgi:hypothetical protein